MKKIILYSLIALMVLIPFGCVRKTTSTAPENAAFTVAVEDEETAEVLAFFQAHTGYLPTVVMINDETIREAEEKVASSEGDSVRGAALKSLADSATCLLLKTESLIAEYEDLGFIVDNEKLKSLTASYRIDYADVLGLTVVQMPQDSSLNLDALKALVSWMTGAEAKYIAENPDLLKN